MTDDFGLKAYERTKEVSKLYKISEKYLIKPCIVNLLAGDNVISRNTSGLILASELLKNGLEKEQIKSIVKRWNNEKCEPNLRENELRKIFNSAFKTKADGKPKYDYGCNTKLQSFCIGKENCIYYQKFLKDKTKTSEPNYVGLKWQHVLTSREFLMIAYFIPYLERKRQYKKGSKIFVSVRELEAITGFNKRYITEILRSLNDYGLIEYKAGISRNWEKKASEIRRILPPPKIPEEFTEDKQTLKRYKKIHKQKEVKISG